jgi:uncharacterized protein (TIGR02246 family)
MSESEIRASRQAWKNALESGNPDNVVKLYDEEGILWGTLSPVIRKDPGSIREYFVKFATLENIQVNFKEEEIRIYDNIAINTGYYNFSWNENGKLIDIPSRYTFVYKRSGDQWLILDHHSSVIPEVPFDTSKFEH